MSEWIPQVHYWLRWRDGSSTDSRYWTMCGRALTEKMITGRLEHVTCKQCRNRKEFKALGTAALADEPEKEPCMANVDTKAIRDFCKGFTATADAGARLPSNGVGGSLSPDDIIALCDALDAERSKNAEWEQEWAIHQEYAHGNVKPRLELGARARHGGEGE